MVILPIILWNSTQNFTACVCVCVCTYQVMHKRNRMFKHYVISLPSSSGTETRLRMLLHSGILVFPRHLLILRNCLLLKLYWLGPLTCSSSELNFETIFWKFDRSFWLDIGPLQASSHAEQHKQRRNADTLPCPTWNSNPRRHSRLRVGGLCEIFS